MPPNEHVLCRLCNIICRDWEEFVKHKVKSDQHICCPICGRDFGSNSGCERHIKIEHQKDQHINCAGCQKYFNRAGALIEHLEKGRCPEISVGDYQDQVHRKDIIGRILRNPETFGSPLSAMGTERSQAPSEIDSEEGGVSLGPLEQRLELDVARLGPTLTPSVRYHNSNSASSIASLVTQVGPCNSDCQVDNDLSARKRMPNQTAAMNCSPSGASRASKTYSNELATSNSATLFSQAASAESGKFYYDGLKVLDNQDASLQEDNGSVHVKSEATQTAKGGMFHTKFWDPDSANYNAQNFYQPVIERYVCPFSNCQQQFDTPLVFSNHLKSRDHHLKCHRCPTCLKVFATGTALIQHCESPSIKCGIRQTQHFEQAIDKFSGGYLEVHRSSGFMENADDWYALDGPDYQGTRPAGFW